MKAHERHQLKQNEFGEMVAKVVAFVERNRDRVIAGTVAGVVIVALGGGYLYWQRRADAAAEALLAVALSIDQSPIVPAPTLPGATQAAGTYPTEAARTEAALRAFEEVTAAHPDRHAGVVARYHAASTLLALGRVDEAEAAYRDVVARAGLPLYRAVAELGLAEVQARQGRYDDAVATLTNLAGDRDGALPVDGVLMQLARVQVRAGRPDEARAVFKRVVDEFPESPYAQEARQQLTLLG